MTICRHYPAYSLVNVWDLTPKQAQLMFVSLNNEKAAILELEMLKEKTRLDIVAKLLGAKKSIFEDSDKDSSKEDTKDMFASLEATTQKQVLELRTKAAKEGAHSGERNNDKDKRGR